MKNQSVTQAHKCADIENHSSKRCRAALKPRITAELKSKPDTTLKKPYQHNKALLAEGFALVKKHIITGRHTKAGHGTGGIGDTVTIKIVD